jgi:hypothetical protein
MDWSTVMSSFSDELDKIASEAKKKAPLHERIVDVGAPVLVGSGVGKTLSDLSFSTTQGAPPRRKTIGTLLGALGGLGWRKLETAKKKKKRLAAQARAASQTKTAADLFKFKGMATPRFLSKPGKSISSQAPKIGRLGALPKMP